MNIKVRLIYIQNGDTVNVEPDHIFISYFNNLNFPTKIDEEIFNNMKDFEINRWNMNKLISKNLERR